MSSSDPKFYTDWLKWSEETAQRIMSRIISGKSSFTQLTRFISDCAAITKDLVTIWDDVPRHGKFLRVLPHVAMWLIAHPDPLIGVRVRMRATQKKWDGELGSP